MSNIQNSTDLDLLKLKYGGLDKIPNDVLLRLNERQSSNAIYSEPISLKNQETQPQSQEGSVQRFLNKYSSGYYGIIPPIVAEKYEGAKKEGRPFVGETVYDIASSKMPSWANAAFTGLGRATGEAAHQVVQAFLNDPDAPKTEKEAVMRMVTEFGVGAGSQYISNKLFNTGRRVGAAAGKPSKPIQPYPNLNELEPIAKKAGIKFTPAERTVSRPIDTLETVAENALFGRGTLRDIKEIQHPAGVRRMTQQLLDDVLPSGGRMIRTSTGQVKPLSKVEVGSMIDDLVTQRNKQFKDVAGALYKHVDDLTKPVIKTKKVTIDVPSVILDEKGNPFIKNVTKTVEEEVGGIVTNISEAKKFAAKIQEQRVKEKAPHTAVDDILSNILNRPDNVNFKSAHNIRSDFLEIERNAPSTKDRVAGIARKAAGIIDSKMKNTTSRLNPEAYKAWRAADSFYSNGKEIFNSELMRKIATSMENGTPEDVVDVIFKGKSPSQINMIMNLIEPNKSGKYTDNLLKRRLRYTFLQDIINKNSRQIPGDVTDLRTLTGKNMLDYLSNNYGENYGNDVLKEIFPEKELKNIMNVARVAKITQGKAGGAGGFLIQVLQAGPLAGVAGGIATGTPELTKKSMATAIPIGGFTYGLAKLMASDNGSKLLTNMMTVKPYTKEYFNLATRISREMLRNELDYKTEQPTKNDFQSLRPYGGRGY